MAIEKIDFQGFGLTKDFNMYKGAKTPFEIINDNFQEIDKVFKMLADEKSKTVLRNILNSKISLDNSYLYSIASSPDQQYFDEELIVLNDDEVFCDCGSFNGDTLKSFLAFSKRKYEKYIAFEADPFICKILMETIENENAVNVKPFNIACWSEKTILSFSQQSSSGAIDLKGEIKVNADSLDNLLLDEKVTFIKMDIEGAEQYALKGAKRLIKKNVPLLAVCLYHSLEDYFKIPLIIREFSDEYEFFIRHYTERVDVETVCYAIPKSRM